MTSALEELGADVARYRLLRFMAKSPKVTGGDEHWLMASLIERGWAEAAPREKGGLIGDGWQITVAGRAALLQFETTHAFPKT